MGPLVPEVIGNEFNFVIAFLIGIAFGFILEQAGFSTSKKLVGLFYGYDFTVLRVFFTAGITAMFGVIALGHFGLLDLNIIYINPTFLWSAIVGGVIMGLGFVIGGFCPGTSVCAAAIGKIDAMIFIAGSIVGVLVFSELYPVFEGLYKAESWGNIRVFESLGISQSLFVFLMIFMAVGTFVLTSFIENKVNGHSNHELYPVRLYVGLAGIVVLIGVTAFALPDRQQELLKDSSNPALTSAMDIKKMTSDELAYRLIDNENSIQIFDLRSKEKYQDLKLPESYNITLDYLFGKDANKQLSLNNLKNVFLAENETAEIKAAFIAQKLGFDEIYILKGGLNEFKDTILNFKMPEKVLTRHEADTYRFRIKASSVIPELIKNAKKEQGTETKKSKRVLGGC
jgi:rhodanese-related sulfurtransferase